MTRVYWSIWALMSLACLMGSICAPDHGDDDNDSHHADDDTFLPPTDDDLGDDDVADDDLIDDDSADDDTTPADDDTSDDDTKPDDDTAADDDTASFDCCPLGADLAGPCLCNGYWAPNPTFVDPEGGDYHLSEDSLCIDTGVAPTDWYLRDLAGKDFEGDPRPSGGRWDIGGDEYVNPLPAVFEVIDEVADGTISLAIDAQD